MGTHSLGAVVSGQQALRCLQVGEARDDGQELGQAERSGSISDEASDRARAGPGQHQGGPLLIGILWFAGICEAPTASSGQAVRRRW
jgi:hypothetical protein